MTKRVLTVDDVCLRVTSGGTPSRRIPEYFNGNIPWLKTQELRDGWIYETEEHITEVAIENSSAKLLPRNTVMMAMYGATVGKLAILGREMTCNQAACAMIVDPAKADYRYLYYTLLNDRIRIVDRANGAAQQNLSARTIKALDYKFPPLAEQRAIAATLGALDDKIESNRRAIGVMEELARSTFEQIFDLEQADDGVALSELVNVNPRRVLRSGTPATYVGMSSLPEFSAEVYKWETREAGSGQRFVLGDVLMARITPCLENGKTAVVDMLQPDEVGWGSTEYVVLSPTGLFSTAWVYCLVRDDRIRDFAIRSMTGTSGRQRFQGDRFSQYRIAPPASVDLVRFNSLAEPLFTRMTQLRDESLKLSALRDALLPELLSGRMRVPIEGVAA